MCTDEPKLYDPFLIYWWSFACRQKHSKLPRHGLYKTQWALWYQAPRRYQQIPEVCWVARWSDHRSDLFQHIPQHTIACSCLVPHQTTASRYSPLLTGSTTQTLPSLRRSDPVIWLQRFSPCQSRSGLCTCPFLQHPTCDHDTWLFTYRLIYYIPDIDLRRCYQIMKVIHFICEWL